MSGGGGGGGWPEETLRSCDDLEFETTLSSPQADVIGDLQQGDELDIALDTSDGVSKVVARDTGGQVAGTITSGEFAALLRCLQEDNTYVAEVINVSGGLVRVRIRHA
jgi:hypothetical protein